MNTPSLPQLFKSPSLSLLAYFRSTCLLFAVLASGPSIADAGDGHFISFDLPPTAVAVPVTTAGDHAALPTGVGETVEVSLRLSSLVCGSELPQIDRWMIRCVPRSSAWRVVDYAPRTETASEYASPIQVKKTDEEASAFGMSTDVAPLKVSGAFVGASGHMGFDKTAKHLNSTQFDRHAPLHAVTASGTIERGRGVYYKLRWTSTQVLEGEKEFKVTFGVPHGFRAGLLDVSVVAVGKPAEGNSMSEAFSQIPVLGDDHNKMRAIGKGQFVVAVHAEGDPDAWRAAESVANTELALRNQAKSIRAAKPSHSLSTLIRHVAAKLDMDSADVHDDWVNRLVFGSADPHTDSVIRKLPTQVRVIALDYCDARKKLETLTTRRSSNSMNSFQLNDLVKTVIAK